MSDFEFERDSMVQRQLVARGITDQRVLEAFRKVPRHAFVPTLEQECAYEDRPLPVGCGQTISQPYMVALMTELLHLTGNEKVLEIGTGSGFQTAILAETAAEVCTVERIAELSERAHAILDGLGYTNIHYKIGDGTLGWEQHAPYDRILVTAGAPDIPPSLTGQLAEGGSIVIPVGGLTSQVLKVAEMRGGQLRAVDSCACVFVKLIGKEGWTA